MKATVKYLSNGTEKQKEMDNFKNVYEFQNHVEVKTLDEEGFENSFKVPKDNFVSLVISK